MSLNSRSLGFVGGSIFIGGIRSLTPWQKLLNADPYAWLPVPPEGEQVPPSQPNAGSVKNRNHQKRMAQRAEFGKVCTTASAFQGRNIVMHPPETGQSLVSLHSRSCGVCYRSISDITEGSTWTL